MEFLNQIIKSICDFLWSLPMLAALLGTHLYFTLRLGFIQKKVPDGIRWSFGSAAERKEKPSADPGCRKGQRGRQKVCVGQNSRTVRREDGQRHSGGVSAYSALATALAATIGTGNIIGISTAIAVGGPGAVFWCWISGLLGMATCYAECFLSVRFRVRREDGSLVGGPMYILDRVLHKKGLAVVFSVFAILAAFAAGSSVQAHSMAAAIREQVDISPHLIGIAAGMLAGTVIIGGAKKIAKVCTWMVPVMSVFFLAGCFVVIGQNWKLLPQTFGAIVGAAFSSRAFIGGAAGTAVMTALRVGMAKGLFTNEAGMGSMPMSAAAAETDSPRRQAIISMTGVFWDTIVMCAITGITIVSSMIKDPALFAGAAQDRLCFIAFSALPWDGERMLSLCLVLFSFATIVGWSFYGECAAHYLAGERGTKLFQIAYMVFVYLGAVMSLDLVWNLSDLCNAFMALPNLVCLWALRKVVVRESCRG